jgi:hypothetical protein
VLSHILEVTDVPAARLQAFTHQLGPRVEEAFMTGAQILRAEGEAKGRAEALLRQLTLRFGPISKPREEKIRGAATDQLDLWLERVLSVRSIDEVFSD